MGQRALNAACSDYALALAQGRALRPELPPARPSRAQSPHTPDAELRRTPSVQAAVGVYVHRPPEQCATERRAPPTMTAHRNALSALVPALLVVEGIRQPGDAPRAPRPARAPEPPPRAPTHLSIDRCAHRPSRRDALSPAAQRTMANCAPRAPPVGAFHQSLRIFRASLRRRYLAL